MSDPLPMGMYHGFAREVQDAAPDAPNWYPLWAATHRRRFCFRREDDALVMADWWPVFEAFGLTEDEAKEASVFLLGCDEKNSPKGRPDHVRKIKARVLSQRKVSAKAISRTEVPTKPMDMEKWLRLREEQKKRLG